MWHRENICPWAGLDSPSPEGRREQSDRRPWTVAGEQAEVNDNVDIITAVLRVTRWLDQGFTEPEQQLEEFALRTEDGG